jgi:multimeric flavodoxin WrbA
MKVIAFNGSPHKDGVIAAGLRIVADELGAAGIETEIVEVGGKSVHGCMDCHGCRKAPFRCTLKDEGASEGFVNECRGKAEEAGGLIIGSPTYYGAIAGTFKCFLDRLFFSGTRLDYKPAAAIASTRRSGVITTFQQLNSYLHLSGAVIVPTRYWSGVHGYTEQDLMEDREGIANLKFAGKNMAWLLESLAAAKPTVPYPVHEKGERTNFIH